MPRAIIVCVHGHNGDGRDVKRSGSEATCVGGVWMLVYAVYRQSRWINSVVELFYVQYIHCITDR